MPIHPDVASRFALLDGATSMEEFFTHPAFQDRFMEWQAWPCATPPPTVATTDIAVPGPHGAVPVRVYGERGASLRRPCLVWFHGGGFIGGDLDMPEADWTSRELAVRAGALVVSVDYRLAVGEVCHPVPLDDCVAAVRWVREHAHELGIDESRILLGGGSAGANLATGATLRLRDEDGWLPAGLLPVYGLFHPQLPPLSDKAGQLLDTLPAILRFTPKTVTRLTTNYVGGSVTQSDGYAMPALAVLEGLCPVTLINAEYDDLRRSGEAFAASLAIAGIEVRQVVAPGMLHAFLNLPADIEQVSAVLDLMAATIRPDERTLVRESFGR